MLPENILQAKLNFSVYFHLKLTSLSCKFQYNMLVLDTQLNELLIYELLTKIEASLDIL
jgi:hypothetical protein